MGDLITLSKGSKDFDSYLLGTFAPDKRALPLQTLNVNSSAETVTFKIVPVSEIGRPSFLQIGAQVLKIRSLLLVLVPLFLMVTKNIADSTLMDPLSTMLATFGVLLAFLAVNVRNDYLDHMLGVDRVLEESGSRAIQKGWVTAARLKSISSVLLILSLLCALPLVLTYNSLAGVIAMGLVIGLWAQFKRKNSFKYRIGGELALFVMLGPLLTVGYQLAMGAPFDGESVWIGCVWGWLTLFVVHLRNFRNIFTSSQAGFNNTVNWLGFDKTRRLLAMWWLVFLAINLGYHLYFAGFYWGFYLSIVLSAPTLMFISKLKNISSPIGSELYEVYKMGTYLFLLTIGMWVFECVWYLFL